ncbi:unnamed protein product [Closterium sp. NIES-54]
MKNLTTRMRWKRMGKKISHGFGIGVAMWQKPRLSPSSPFSIYPPSPPSSSAHSPPSPSALPATSNFTTSMCWKRVGKKISHGFGIGVAVWQTPPHTPPLPSPFSSHLPLSSLDAPHLPLPSHVESHHQHVLEAGGEEDQPWVWHRGSRVAEADRQRLLRRPAGRCAAAHVPATGQPRCSVVYPHADVSASGAAREGGEGRGMAGGG